MEELEKWLLTNLAKRLGIHPEDFGDAVRMIRALDRLRRDSERAQRVFADPGLQILIDKHTGMDALATEKKD